MRVILTSILFLLVSCSEPPKPKQETRPLTPKQTMRRSVGSSVVRITSEDSGGTGFAVKAPSGKTYILTNKHICGLRDSENRLTIEFPGLTRKYQKRVIEISEAHDLCLVESVPAFSKSLEVAKSFNVGEGVYVVGHPKLFALTVAEGEYIEEATIRVAMSGANKKPVVVVPSPRVEVGAGFASNVVTLESSRLHVYSRGGNSGSPIVNFDGKLVSVLFAGNPYDNHETYGVPLRFVKDFLEGY